MTLVNEIREPIYDFMLIVESIEDFNRAERLIYSSLAYCSNMEKWCEIMTNGTLYACEVPSPDRLMRISSAGFILPYLDQIQAEPQRLEEFKTLMIADTDQAEWKWLISKLQIVNRNEYKIM